MLYNELKNIDVPDLKGFIRIICHRYDNELELLINGDLDLEILLRILRSLDIKIDINEFIRAVIFIFFLSFIRKMILFYFIYLFFYFYFMLFD